jgi:hypothetical protein
VEVSAIKRGKQFSIRGGSKQQPKINSAYGGPGNLLSEMEPPSDQNFAL